MTHQKPAQHAKIKYLAARGQSSAARRHIVRCTKQKATAPVVAWPRVNSTSLLPVRLIINHHCINTDMWKLAFLCKYFTRVKAGAPKDAGPTHNSLQFSPSSTAGTAIQENKDTGHIHTSPLPSQPNNSRDSPSLNTTKQQAQQTQPRAASQGASAASGDSFGATPDSGLSEVSSPGLFAEAMRKLYVRLKGLSAWTSRAYRVSHNGKRELSCNSSVRPPQDRPNALQRKCSFPKIVPKIIKNDKNN